MKTKLLQKLQRLQDYSSLCGLTILMADHEGKQVTELSGLMDIIGLLLKVRNLPEKDTVAYMVEKIHPIDKPIVYESVRGFKLLVAPIRIKGQTLFYIFAGILVDESMKDLIAQKLFEDVPMHEWETWKRALQSTPTYDQDRMKVILQQIEELAEMIQALLEWDREEGNRASRLQLINLLSLMDRNDPNWLRGVLKVFVRVIELEFAGFACKTKGEQFTVTETIGFKGRESLQGATFFTGEGFFGQVGLTKQMGYWEKLDRDPRAAFFKTRGIKPKVIICYPIKYKDQLLGLLFGGHSSLEELSEELADMGALVANQLSADLYCFEMEGKNERRRIRIEALLEMTQGVVDVQEKELFFHMAIESLQRVLQVSFICLVMKKCGEDGIDLYSSGTKSEQLSSVYADDTVSQYLGEGQAEFGLFRKPIQREWHQLELVEYPLVFKEELLGVLGVIFESDKAYKENMFFLNAISVLMVIKLQQMSKEVGMTDAAFSLEEEPLKRSFELFLATREEMAFVQQPLDKCRLTPRETEILNQVLQGLNNLEIAKKLFISTHTVKNHITKIYEKLGVIDRAQAIAKMYRKL